MQIRKSIPGVVSLILAVTTAIASAEDEWSPLPLGRSNLSEFRTSTPVAHGITYTRIHRGKQSERDAWTVDVAFKTNREDAWSIGNALRDSGYDSRVERVSARGYKDNERGLLGFLVRVGKEATQAEATALRDQLVADGYTGLRIVYTGEDGKRTTGPWLVHVLELDPGRFFGAIAPELGTEIVPGTELLTSIAARTNALAAITGGYFVIGPADGTPGDLAGISVIDGALVSEAVDGRTSLILPRGNGVGASIAAVASEQNVNAEDGAKREIDGLNRQPGLIRGCGGDGGDTPTEAPMHDFTCKDDSELILFTPNFGAMTEPGPGFEVALDAAGRVIEAREARGGSIPLQGAVLSGTTEAADWLRAHARVGSRLGIETTVQAEGELLTLGSGVGVVNGGPRLLRDGERDITAAAEGFHWPENPEFFYRFGIRRNPRTLAGITAAGKLLFVAVDGRQPSVSVGASFNESAGIMQALGAVQALNLDGGGSTAITLGARLVNNPSDATGERPLGDAIVIRL